MRETDTSLRKRGPLSRPFSARQERVKPGGERRKGGRWSAIGGKFGPLGKDNERGGGGSLTSVAGGRGNCVFLGLEGRGMGKKGGEVCREIAGMRRLKLEAIDHEAEEASRFLMQGNLR